MWHFRTLALKQQPEHMIKYNLLPKQSLCVEWLPAGCSYCVCMWGYRQQTQGLMDSYPSANGGPQVKSFSKLTHAVLTYAFGKSHHGLLVSPSAKSYWQALRCSKEPEQDLCFSQADDITTERKCFLTQSLFCLNTLDSEWNTNEYKSWFGDIEHLWKTP